MLVLNVPFGGWHSLIQWKSVWYGNEKGFLGLHSLIFPLNVRKFIMRSQKIVSRQYCSMINQLFCILKFFVHEMISSTKTFSYILQVGQALVQTLGKPPFCSFKQINVSRQNSLRNWKFTIITVRNNLY